MWFGVRSRALITSEWYHGVLTLLTRLSPFPSPRDLPYIFKAADPLPLVLDHFVPDAELSCRHRDAFSGVEPHVDHEKVISFIIPSQA